MSNKQLYHWGILGMKWGVRRYQNRDGTLTPLGKQHLAENRIRTEDNLGEKTIPKGSKMYRVTPEAKDGKPSKSAYVTYLDTDRNMYKEGTLVKQYADKKRDDPVYEHEFELKTDIRIPSLKTVRQIQDQVLSDEKKKLEVVKSYVESHMMNDGYTRKDISILSDTATKVNSATTDDQRRQVYKNLCKKYGDQKGDEYYYSSMYIAEAKDWVNTRDSLVVEQSLGRASATKASIIKELRKQGYNAMYDNASIGVESDGRYNKQQEGIEPLIIFDAEASLKKVNTRRVDTDEQRESGRKYEQWKTHRTEVLRDFQ